MGGGGGVSACAKLDSRCTFPPVSVFTKFYWLCVSHAFEENMYVYVNVMFITPRSVLQMCSCTAMKRLISTGCYANNCIYHKQITDSTSIACGQSSFFSF